MAQPGTRYRRTGSGDRDPSGANNGATPSRIRASSSGTGKGIFWQPPTPVSDLGDSDPVKRSAPTPPRSLRTKTRYMFDRTLSRGSGVLVLWLTAVTTVFVIIGGAFLNFVVGQTNVDGDGSKGAVAFVESSWDSLMHTLDPGTVTGDSGWPYRLAALAITIGGIFIFSTLIGIIGSIIDRTLETLRKGRGIVVEEGHTLILGWNEKLHTIVQELKIANENQQSGAIVILAPRDRVQMEDEINARFGGSFALELLTGRTAFGMLKGLTRRGNSGTRIICRTGDPGDPSDLAIASPTTAKGIIVLRSDGPDPDAHAAKVLLSLMSFDRSLSYSNLTIELEDQSHALAIQEASGNRATTIVSDSVVASVTAQVCRQAGMGAVFQELLDFDGCEFYVTNDKRLDGVSYGQALLSFEESTVVGIRTTDGRFSINPPMNTRIPAGASLLVIAEDDDTSTVSQVDTWTPTPLKGGDSNDASPCLEPDHLLMIGWNNNAARVLRHLDKSSPPGSSIDVVVNTDLSDVSPTDFDDVTSIELEIHDGDGVLSEVLAYHLDRRTYERIVIVGYRDALSPEQADARTLLTLVQVRRYLNKGHRNEHASIVAELLEPRSVHLGRIANPDDFVVSERLTSLLLAQLTENPELGMVFDELLDGEGTEINIFPLNLYRTDTENEKGTSTTWREIVAAAREIDQSAIGFVLPHNIRGDDESGVIVNPRKSVEVPLDDGVQVITVSSTT